MERRLNQISEGLHKCLRCEYYLHKKCGAYFDVDIPRWSEEDFYMSSPEEREEREAMCLEFPCEEAKIPEDNLSSGEEREMVIPDTEKARRRFLLKCFRVLSEIPQENALFWNQYGRQISEEVYNLIAQLDFNALEDGKDIINEIDMMSLDYSRENHLYSRYPRKLIEHVVSEVNKRKEEASRIHVEGETLVIPTQQTPIVLTPKEVHNYTPIKQEEEDVFSEFKRSVSFPGIYTFLGAVLYKFGYKHAVQSSIQQQRYRDPEQLSHIIYEFPSRYFVFTRWKELRNYISAEIKKVKDDEDEIRKFVFSLLKLFHPYASLYRPKDDAELEYKESAVLLHLLRRNRRATNLNEVADIWPDLVDEVSANFPNRRNLKGEREYLDALGNTYLKRLPFSREKKQNAVMAVIDAVYENMHKTAILIYGCLLENGIKGKYYKYQKEAGVELIKIVYSHLLTSMMEWTPEMTKSYTGVNEATPNTDSDKSNKYIGTTTITTTTVNVAPVESKPIVPPPPPDRLKEHLEKAAAYFPGGRWYNDNRKEYAIFLKVLFCIVYRKDWVNHVQWKKLTIVPLSNGTLLSIDQLKGALKGYDDVSDDGIRKGFAELLSS